MSHITQSKPSQDNWEHHFLIDLDKPCKCLSSAVLGGGFTRSRYFITTDAIAIVNYLDTPNSAHAGLATPAGYAIGQTVCQASLAALKG